MSSLGSTTSGTGETVAAQEIPTDFQLSQNFPNPFNPVTSIRYGLPRDENVTLRVFNILGEEVATLLNDEPRSAGFHVAIWDGRDQQGRQVASGVYVYRLQTEAVSQTKKLLLLK